MDGAKQQITDRRAFVRTGAAVVGSIVLAPAMAGAAQATSQATHSEPVMPVGHAEADGYVIEATTTRHCGTCEFWGGPRRISTDRKKITTTGLGWCNNPISPDYQKQTTPDHGPMDVWKKWQALA
jgi:hypothetical protein